MTSLCPTSVCHAPNVERFPNLDNANFYYTIYDTYDNTHYHLHNSHNSDIHHAYNHTDNLNAPLA